MEREPTAGLTTFGATVEAVFDAIVLAGGAALRLQGADKPALRLGDLSLLDHVVTAVAGARRTVIVGPSRAVNREVVWCREHPPGGGPVAAVAEGLGHVGADYLLVLAADLPWIAPAVPVLLDALRDGADASVLVDAAGRRNYLAAAWRTVSLRRALAAIAATNGASARSLYAAADIVEVSDTAGWGRDCDTWEDLAEARRLKPQKEPMVTNPLDSWVAELAAALGVDPASVDRDLLLDAARDAAHGVARPAAPLTTFLVGLAAGLHGGGTEAVREAATTAQRLALAHAQPETDAP